MRIYAALCLGVVASAAIGSAACRRPTPTGHAPSPQDFAAAATGPLRGWVDLHAHPMSYLGFGGKAIAGGVAVGIDVPADARCHHDVPPGTIDDALGNDRAIHGPWSLDHLCGDFLRSTLVPIWESAQGKCTAVEHPGEAAGPPGYGFWPAWNDMLHQKMTVEWMREAFKGGQRVMVALAVHDDLTARAFSGPGDGPNDDDGSIRAQTKAMTDLVRNSDFMEIALDAEAVDRIVRARKMAVVLGTETDSLGTLETDPVVIGCQDMGPHCAARAKEKVVAAVEDLWSQGIRYVFPVHITDNVFGGTAVYTGIFNLANQIVFNRPWTLECAAPDEKIRYDGSFGVGEGEKLALKAFVLAKMFRGFSIPDPPKCPFGVRNSRGLTKLGEFAIQEMMRRGMLIDIDHMSEYAADRTLDLAEAVPDGGYPIMAGHNAVRGTPPTDAPYVLDNGATELQRTPDELTRIAGLHGMFGIATAMLDSHTWIADYGQATELVPAPGAVTLGTDLDGMVVGSPPSTPGWKTRCNGKADIAQSPHPPWHYKTDGVVHYGLLPEFLDDAKTVHQDGSVDGADLVDNRVFASAAYFQETWARAQRQATKVGTVPAVAATAAASAAPAPAPAAVAAAAPQACAAECCEACSACASKGVAGGSCADCRGCQTRDGCVCAAASPTPAAPLPKTMDVGALEPACKGNDLSACHAAGVAYEQGRGVEEDPEKARSLYRRACDKGRGESCLYLGRMFGEGSGATQDHAEALKLFRRACDLGVAAGCHHAAGSLLADAGVPVDAKGASGFERRACNAKFREGCLALAQMLDNGTAGQKDVAGATEIYERMCAHGDEDACRLRTRASP